MRPLPRVRSTLRNVLVTATTVATAAVVLSAPAQASTNVASGDRQVTPGNFTGYGFDQCLTPTQYKMDKWMDYSPFAAVGIYISGYSRACRDQPNLTKSWVTRQLRNKWNLLPITLGPQASCQPRFPRYGNDATINPRSGNNYGKARRQGRTTAVEAVAAAKNLGIDERSTLWYDLEGFDLGNTACRESALRFLHSWTTKLHKLNYVSGVYSSAGSGIKMLDDARINRPDAFNLPDAIWIARWDGVANTSTSYISDYGWRPHKRVKQYLGGHDETWGGVTINIDSNWMSLGRGSLERRKSTKCRGVYMNLASYPRLSARSAPTNAVKALQCNLRLRDFLTGPINGELDARTLTAVRSLQSQAGVKVQNSVNRRLWTILLSQGDTRPLKRGFNGPRVRQLQRALAAGTGKRVPVTGVFNRRTERITMAWQDKVGLRQSGVMDPPTWQRLKNGR